MIISVFVFFPFFEYLTDGILAFTDLNSFEVFLHLTL